MTPLPRIFALIVAAGTGSRAGGAVPKQYAPIGGKPLLRHSIEALAAHPRIAAVQVVIHADHADYYTQAVRLGAPLPAGEAVELGLLKANLSGTGEGGHPVPPRPHPDLQPIAPRGDWANPTSPAGRGGPVAPSLPKLLPPVRGGVERSDSVRAGLAALEDYQPDYVLIHDAARPFLSHTIIDALIAKLTPDHAVVPALAVPDTVRRFDGAKWEEVSRDGLLRIQTPQAFPFKTLEKIYASGATATDEAAIWLAAGHELAYVAGDEELRKVTTAQDIAWAEKKYAPTRTAVGMGYDVHTLVAGAGTIRLGGIDIAHSHKLHGHSDADVVLHAIVDALLGTIAAGDIGSHFPPSDARWKGANSAIFIEEARAQVASRGGVIQHLDITIIGEQPKISPHRDAMRASIASLLKLPLARVSVKATTTEKLGFTGREEGIACSAIATVTLPEEVCLEGGRA